MERASINFKFDKKNKVLSDFDVLHIRIGCQTPEKELLLFLMKNYKREFTPIEVSKAFGVTNKTIINRLAVLVKNGLVVPNLGKERIRSYELSDFVKQFRQEEDSKKQIIF